LSDHHEGDYGLLALGVLAASTSAPLIAACAAPALAIAFWRTAGATLVLGPVALARGARSVPRRPLLLALAAGAALAVHFGTFIPSLSYTSVASSAALVASQAVWAALLSIALGERLPGRAWVGIALCFAGVLAITGVDVSLDARALGGDALALAGGIFGGVYIVTGGFVRRDLDTATYTGLCYGTCALLLLIVCLAGGQSLSGYAADDWLRVAAITVFGQLMGHSLFNLVLRSISPTLVSLAGLFTVPGAAIIAAVTLSESPPWEAIPAMLLLIAGTALVISARARAAVA